MGDFFRLTKAKIAYLIVVGLVVLISGGLAENVIMCSQAPCEQAASTIIGQKIYSVVTFNKMFINTQFAVQLKNILRPIFSAGTSYSILSFIISMSLHYLIISLIIDAHAYYKKKQFEKI